MGIVVVDFEPVIYKSRMYLALQHRDECKNFCPILWTKPRVQVFSLRHKDGYVPTEEANIKTNFNLLFAFVYDVFETFQGFIIGELQLRRL